MSTTIKAAALARSQATIAKPVKRLLDFLRSAYFGSEMDYQILGAFVLLSMLARLHTFSSFPYLAVTGPSGSGKSTLARVLVLLTRGILSGARTPAALLRHIHESPGRLIVMDEGEAVLRGERRALFEAILLNGDHITGTVERASARASDGICAFSVGGPKALVSIRGVDTSALLRRIVQIESRECPMAFIPMDVMTGKALAQATQIHEDLLVWAKAVRAQVRERLAAHLASPRFLSPSHRSLWAVMLATADAAGIDLSRACAEHGKRLKGRIEVSLQEALTVLLDDLAPGRYTLTTLHQRLREQHGARADFWGAVRIGRALRQLKWEVRRSGHERYVEKVPELASVASVAPASSISQEVPEPLSQESD